MKQLMKAILEEQIAHLDNLITVMMDELDGLTNELEAIIEVPQTPEDLEEALEMELEELINDHCISATFATDGNMTIASALVKGFPYPMIGIAKCDPTDEFNETVGDIVALKRALGIPVDPAQYGKAKIEKDCGNCKYDDRDLFDYPCNKCLELDDNDTRYWELATEEVHVDCDTCLFDGTSTRETPCPQCLAVGYHILWMRGE